MTIALLDPLTRQSHMVKIGNASYRVTQAAANTKKRIKARQTERKGSKSPPADHAPEIEPGDDLHTGSRTTQQQQ
jgi:hypothetical protein